MTGFFHLGQPSFTSLTKPHFCSYLIFLLMKSTFSHKSFYNFSRPLLSPLSWSASIPLRQSPFTSLIQSTNQLPRPSITFPTLFLFSSTSLLSPHSHSLLSHLTVYFRPFCTVSFHWKFHSQSLLHQKGCKRYEHGVIKFTKLKH
jgi:hypothetical protein